MLFVTPQLDPTEGKVLDLIRDQWRRLHMRLTTTPGRWQGLLRQSAMARGIRGSNSIEGYTVSEDDAVAAVEGDEPYDTDQEAPSWLAVVGYRDAVTHALRQGVDPEAVIDATLLRSLHFMMMRYDMTKHPGKWRPGPVFVHDGRTDEVVYEGPHRDMVPKLIEELVNQLNTFSTDSPLVRAAMAHLNLTMIHPFSDGNGRMARCLQTLVLAREAHLVDPVFASVEEWLGARRNTDEYYAVLAEVGGGSWQPQRDARPWVRFMLKAHFQQAATFERREQETAEVWAAVEGELEAAGLPERAAAPLVEAAFGRAIRNSRYRVHADVNQRTASRDLQALVESGFLESSGRTRGTTYRASPSLRDVRNRARHNKDVHDPFTLVA